VIKQGGSDIAKNFPTKYFGDIGKFGDLGIFGDGNVATEIKLIVSKMKNW
jgi:hypothetical protein